MMNLFALLLVIIVCFVPSSILTRTAAFSARLQPRSSTKTYRIRLYGIWDFRPFHGHGSGEHEKDLDEQWEIQQEILRARRGHVDKTALKKKYAHGAQGDLSGLGGAGSGKIMNHRFGDEIYMEGDFTSIKKKHESSSTPAPQRGGTNKEKSKMKFFWEK